LKETFQLENALLNGSRVISSNGYAVDFSDTASVEYRDELGTVIVGSERLANATLALYLDQFWTGSYPGLVLDDEPRKQLVIIRIVAAAKYRGLKVDLGP
jgi:hypothetical protein